MKARSIPDSEASRGAKSVLRSSTQLRGLLEQTGVLVAPCAYDCVSLRIMERAGFEVAMHGGYNSAGSLLGMPDVGLITMTEMIGSARNMAASVDIPVICDVDDGFGNVVNVTRTTREAIRSGLAGFYIEDQAFPKRCPALGGGDVIPKDTMVRKLRAVARVREEEDPDFVVVARTHASRAIGMKDAIERGIAYAKEGADMIWVDLGYDESVIEELRIIAEEIGPHAHLVANMTETVGRPLLTSEELYEMGYKVVTYPLTALMTAAGALAAVFAELREKGTTRAMVDRMMSVEELGRLVGIDEVRQTELEFGVDGQE